MNEIFSHVLVIGPSSKRKGGIASVLRMYKNNINTNYFESTKFQSTFLSFLFFPFRIISLIVVFLTKKNIKLVHIHGSSEGSFYRKYVIFKVSRLFKKKIIFHLHSGRFDSFYKKSNTHIKKRIEKLISQTDATVVLSKTWKEYLEVNFNPKQVFVVGNMISFPIKDENQILDSKSKSLKFTYLGKIFQPKGVYDLLDVIIDKNDILVDKAHFVIAGSGEEDKTQKYEHLDINNLVEFTGWLDETRKNQLLLKTDVLILPSYSEGLPVSVLEAMSYKKGVITTNVGGIPEIVKNNYNGIMISPGSEKELFDAIIYYINHENEIKNHGEKGYEMAKDYFPDSVKKRLESIYNSIVYN